MTYRQEQDNVEALKALSSKDFLNFGVQDVAYIRMIEVDGTQAFAIHAADGTPLSVMETRDAAFMTITQNDLEAISVH